MTLHGKFFENR